MSATNARGGGRSRRAQNRKPATYRCPLCGRHLPALSEHMLIVPEGDASRRRHAHTALRAGGAQGGPAADARGVAEDPAPAAEPRASASAQRLARTARTPRRIGFRIDGARPATRPERRLLGRRTAARRRGDRSLEAEQLGFDSIWTAEAYGSDATHPLAWWGAATERIKLGTAIVQISARTPGRDGDGGDDARPPLGRAADPRARGVRARRSSRAGTASRSRSRSRGRASTSGSCARSGRGRVR